MITAAPVATESGPTRRDRAGLAVLAAGLGMIVLDGTIVAVALPAIMKDLQLSLAQGQWVNSLYSVIFAALLVTAGQLGDRFGRRLSMIVGVVIFIVGSILAAVSSGADTLLAARAVQGVGGALVLPATLSTVNATFRGRSRAAAFGVWGAVMAGAAALGPLLGGWLTQVSGWPLIFWVNVPLSVLVIVGAVVFVTETRSERRGAHLDLLGVLLSAAAFGLVVFGLIEGANLGWWRPKTDFDLLGLTWPATAPLSPAPAALIVGIVCLAGFLAWQARQGSRGLVDLALFRIRTFALGNTTATLVAVGEFALLFVLPLYLVTILKLSTLSSGLVLAAMAIGAFASGAAARHLAVRLGTTRTVLLGLGLEVVGATVAGFTVWFESPAWQAAVALVPYGLGLGLASAQLTSTTLRDVPTDRSGEGSATQSTVRQLGAALGSALGGSVLSAIAGGVKPDHSFAAGTSVAIWIAAGILTVAFLSAVRLDHVDRVVSRPARGPEPAPAREPVGVDRATIRTVDAAAGPRPPR